MNAAWAWARRELTRNRRAAIALVLLIGISGGVALTAAAGARRTASSFDRMLDSSNTADAQLQYTSTDQAQDEALMRALAADPDVERATPLYIVIGFSEDSDYDLGVYASPDPSEFDEVDGLRILDGRTADPGSAREVTINRFTQHALRLDVGDTVTIGTFCAEQFQEDEPSGDPAGPTIELEVVGINLSPYDLADPEFAGFFGTTAFFEEYWGVAGGYGPIVEVNTVPGADAAATAERAVADLDLEEVFVTPVSDLTERVADGISVLAVGLAGFAVAAGLATAVACAQALHRRLGDSAPDLPALRAIGLTGSQTAAAVMLSVAPVVAGGVILATALAVASSPLMPVGTARQAEPAPGLDVDLSLLGVGAGALAVLLMLVVATSATRLAGRSAVAHGFEAPGRKARWVRAPLSPPSQLGVAMALDPGRGATAIPTRSTVVGAAFGIAGVVAALTFGAGLDRLVDDPAASGWNWTFAPDVAEEQAQAVIDIPEVEDVGQLSFNQVLVDGSRTTGVGLQALKGSPSLTVVRGRMPTGPRELALGPATADRLGLGSGDTVHIEDDGGGRDMVVVGEVLFPTFDENRFNDGVAMTSEVLHEVANSDGFDRGIVTFADDVPEAVAAQRMEKAAPGSMSVYAYPTPPPDVANLEAVRFLPQLLGGFLGLLALAAVGHALASSARRRRRDLGIVRSLGFVSRDLRQTLAAQSTTLVVLGLVLGVPLGVAVGRTAWRVVADGIGVPAHAATALGVLLLVAIGAVLAGMLLSILPGRSAARRHTVDSLRVE